MELLLISIVSLLTALCRKAIVDEWFIIECVREVWFCLHIFVCCMKLVPSEGGLHNVHKLGVLISEQATRPGQHH